MRIAISGMFWGQPTVGSGQYLHGMLGELARVAPQHEYVLLLPAYLADERRMTNDERRTTDDGRRRGQSGALWTNPKLEDERRTRNSKLKTQNSKLA